MVEFSQTNWKKPFFLIWSGQIFSLLGSGLVGFALIWWLTSTTGSATVLAFATLAQILPDVFLGPFAGALVDRWNRRVVMIAADLTIAAATLALGVLFWLGGVQPWMVYIILFIRAVGGSFHWPAMQASTSLMVPDKHLTRIAGLNQTLRGILNIATPPLGALLISILPTYGVIAIDVVTALIAVTPLLFVNIPQPKRANAAEVVTPRMLLRDVKEGLRYTFAWPGLLAILGMAMLINFLFNPAMMLMPLLVKNFFQGDAWHLSIMESGWGIGLVAGSLLLSAWGGFKRKVVTSMVGLIGMGAFTLLVGFAPASLFGLAVAGISLAGFANPIVNGPLMATLQSRVEPGMQGRIFTLVQSGAAAMMPLGTLLAAPVAENLGIQAWFLAAGVGTVLMGVLGFLIPVVVNFENDPAHPPIQVHPLPEAVSQAG